MASTILESVVNTRLDMTAETTSPDWLPGYESYLARGTVTLLAGREGEGKSLWAQHAALDLASAPNKLKVLVLDVENGPRLIHERMHKMGLRDTATNDPELYKRLATYAPMAFDFGETGSRAGEAFMAFQEMVNIEEPDVIILDSLRSLYGQSLNSAKIGGLLNLLRRVAGLANCSIIIIHHTTKSGNSYLGSNAIGSTCEMVYYFLREKDDPDPMRRVLRCYKNRLTQEPDDKWLQIEAEANGTILQLGSAEPFIESEHGHGRNQLTTLIMYALIANPGMSRSEIARKVKKDAKDRTVGRILEALCETGQLQKTAGGKYHVIFTDDAQAATDNDVQVTE